MENSKNSSEIKDYIFNADNTASWELNVEGDIQGLYKGTFIFKCYLNPTDILAKGRLFRELLGPNPSTVTEMEYQLAYALSELSKRVVKAPPFWSATLQNSSFQGDLPDLNVLLVVLNAATDAEIAYRKTLAERKEQALKKAENAAKVIRERLNANPEIEP